MQGRHRQIHTALLVLTFKTRELTQGHSRITLLLRNAGLLRRQWRWETQYWILYLRLTVIQLKNNMNKVVGEVDSLKLAWTLLLCGSIYNPLLHCVLNSTWPHKFTREYNKVEMAQIYQLIVNTFLMVNEQHYHKRYKEIPETLCNSCRAAYLSLDKCKLLEFQTNLVLCW